VSVLCCAHQEMESATQDLPESFSTATGAAAANSGTGGSGSSGSGGSGGARQRRQQPRQTVSTDESGHPDSDSSPVQHVSEGSPRGELEYFRKQYGHHSSNMTGNTGQNSRKHGFWVTAATTACVALVLIVITVLIGLGYLLVTRLGFGRPFPDQNYHKLAPLLPESSLEVVAELPTPAGNIAVSKTGRIFFNFHPVSEAFCTCVVNVLIWIFYLPGI
jgi:hypothetical protein